MARKILCSKGSHSRLAVTKQRGVRRLTTPPPPTPRKEALNTTIDSDSGTSFYIVADWGEEEEEERERDNPRPSDIEAPNQEELNQQTDIITII